MADKTLKIKVSRALFDLYCFYRQRWVCVVNADTTVTIKKKYNIGTIMNHLEGKYSVCVFAGKNATSFLSIDVDMADPDVVHKVIDTIEELGVPRQYIYVSGSGRKGYHVDIFFKDFIYNSRAEKFYWAVIERGSLNPRKVEYRPTHTQAIKLPLGVHQTTQRRCWYVDRETLEPIEDYEYIFNVERIPAEYMNGLVDNIVKEHMRGIYDKTADRPAKQPERGYASLVVTEPGTRHNIQKKVAARARMDGNDFDDIVRIQMEWYEAQDQRLIRSNRSEVLDDAEKIAAWAVKNIEVKAHEIRQNPCSYIRIDKKLIPYILNAPTKATRLVLFLLALFCRRYGEARISYETIAKYTGLSVKTAEKAVAWLADNKYIGKECTYYRQNVFVTKRGVNKYTFPGEKKYYAPDRKYLKAEYADIREFVSADNLRDICYRTLAQICKPEYLAKYMTKTEMAEVRRWT